MSSESLQLAQANALQVKHETSDDFFNPVAEQALQVGGEIRQLLAQFNLDSVQSVELKGPTKLGIFGAPHQPGAYCQANVGAKVKLDSGTCYAHVVQISLSGPKQFWRENTRPGIEALKTALKTAMDKALNERVS